MQFPERNMVEIIPPVAEAAPPWETLRAQDDRNLEKLIGARLTGQITGEDLMRGAATTIKTYTLDEVADYVLSAEKQFMQQSKPAKDSMLGAKCACPGCQQNTSYPNPAGQCVTCWSGDHMHPGGQDAAPDRPNPAAISDWGDLNEHGEPVVSRPGGNAVPISDPIDATGDNAPEWEEPDEPGEVHSISSTT